MSAAAAQRRRAAIDLRSLGVPDPPRMDMFLLGTAGAVCSIVLVIAAQFVTLDVFVGLLSTMLAGIAVIMALYQWRAARYETSMDRLYERLNSLDERLNTWPSAQEMLVHFWGTVEQFEQVNYVWNELDNLEYVIEKYKLGYMRADHAVRGVRTFASRCRSERFREIVTQIVGAMESTGYHSTTTHVVRRIIANVQPDNSPATASVPATN